MGYKILNDFILSNILKFLENEEQGEGFSCKVEGDRLTRNFICMKISKNK